MLSAEQLRQLHAEDPTLDAAVALRAAVVLAASPSAGGKGVALGKIFGILRAAARSRREMGYDFAEIAAAMAGQTANIAPTLCLEPADWNGLSIAIIRDDAGLWRNVVASLIGSTLAVPRIRVVPSKDVLKCCRQRKFDAVIWPLRRGESPLGPRRVWSQLEPLPIVVVGPADSYVAISAIDLGATEYLEADRLAAWLTGRLWLAIRDSLAIDDAPPSTRSAPSRWDWPAIGWGWFQAGLTWTGETVRSGLRIGFHLAKPSICGAALGVVGGTAAFIIQGLLFGHVHEAIEQVLLRTTASPLDRGFALATSVEACGLGGAITGLLYGILMLGWRRIDPTGPPQAGPRPVLRTRYSQRKK